MKLNENTISMIFKITINDFYTEVWEETRNSNRRVIHDLHVTTSDLSLTKTLYQQDVYVQLIKQVCVLLGILKLEDVIIGIFVFPWYPKK